MCWIYSRAMSMSDQVSYVLCSTRLVNEQVDRLSLAHTRKNDGVHCCISVAEALEVMVDSVLKWIHVCRLLDLFNFPHKMGLEQEMEIITEVFIIQWMEVMDYAQPTS